MAVNWYQNVIVVDSESDQDLTDMTVDVKSVKLIGGSASTTLKILEGGSGGNTLYESTVASGAEKIDDNPCVRINGSATPRVELSGSGGIAYIYLR